MKMANMRANQDLGNTRDFGEHAGEGGNKRGFGEHATESGKKRDFGEYATKVGGYPPPPHPPQLGGEEVGNSCKFSGP